MAKELKVFGGTIFYGSPRKQVRIIIGAYTKKQALELVNTINTISYKNFSDFFGETGNSIELSVANEVGMWITNERNIYKTDSKNYTRIFPNFNENENEN